MRAKEYIAINEANLKYPVHIKQIISEMLPIRADKQKTVDYYNKKLTADIRLQGYLLAKELYEKNNALQTIEPEEFHLEQDEIPVEIAPSVRDELFDVIKEDKTFGYLYFLLGNLRNSLRPNNPIDCVPDERSITEALKISRDDYPKANLAEYLDDDINYAQYRKLVEHGISDQEELLIWFNNAYRIFDEIRLLKTNPLNVIQFYKDDTTHTSDASKTLTYHFICDLVLTLYTEEKRLNRIRNEILRILPIDSTADHSDETVIDSTKGSNKIKTVLIYEILEKFGKGRSFNDLTKICALVAYLTGGSFRKIYNEAQKGIQLTDYHKKELSEVNQILADLSLDIEIKKDKEY